MVGGGEIAMQVKDFILILQQLPQNIDLTFQDLNDNVYFDCSTITIQDNKLILPLNITNHEWREDIAEKMYI